MPSLALCYYVEADLSSGHRHPIAQFDLTNQRVSLQIIERELFYSPQFKAFLIFFQ